MQIWHGIGHWMRILCPGRRTLVWSDLTTQTKQYASAPVHELEDCLGMNVLQELIKHSTLPL